MILDGIRILSFTTGIAGRGGAMKLREGSGTGV